MEHGGDHTAQPSSVRVGYRNYMLDSGDAVEFSRSITALVGPNNAGKSWLLRNLRKPGHQTDAASFGVRSGTSTIYWEGPSDAAAAWLAQVYPVRWSEPTPNRPAQRSFFVGPDRGFGKEGWMDENHFRTWWDLEPDPGQTREERFFNFDIRLFSIWLGVEDRLNRAATAPSFNPIEEKPSTAHHHILSDDQMAVRLSTFVEAAFGTPVSVLKGGGPSISLHIGRPTCDYASDPERYFHDMAALPKVEEQGHGIRAYVGLLLDILTANQKILLVDEPEAFLHPPQARIMGRALAQLRQSGVQVILATHSSDILHGLLDGAEDFAIVRLTRPRGKTHAVAMDSGTTEELKRDTLLRHSTVVDGLFYDGTVVCESDGDATYYRAVDSLISGNPTHRGELHFTHTSGAGRLDRAVRSLKSVDVPVVSMIDIDVLRDNGKLKQLVDAHGATLQSLDINRDLSTLRQSVQRDVPPLLRRDVLTGITPILDREGGFSRRDAKEVNKIWNQLGAWESLKRKGCDALDERGKAAFDRIDIALRSVGIVVVRVGELESFHPEVDRDPKSQWITTVMERRLFADPGAQHDMIEYIREYVDARKSRRLIDSDIAI